jgi:3-oxoacyl-[acyl-carrier protein] reductase
MPIPTLGLSNGARAGLTGFVGGLARQFAAGNVTINNLLPGPFATDRLKDNFRFQAEKSGTSFDEEWRRREEENPSRRFGDPEEFGALCAFVCGARAGYITGQNLLIDGGAYPGTL